MYIQIYIYQFILQSAGHHWNLFRKLGEVQESFLLAEALVPMDTSWVATTGAAARDVGLVSRTCKRESLGRGSLRGENRASVKMLQDSGCSVPRSLGHYIMFPERSPKQFLFKVQILMDFEDQLRRSHKTLRNLEATAESSSNPRLDASVVPNAIAVTCFMTFHLTCFTHIFSPVWKAAKSMRDVPYP